MMRFANRRQNSGEYLVESGQATSFNDDIGIKLGLGPYRPKITSHSMNVLPLSASLYSRLPALYYELGYIADEIYSS